MGSPQTGLRTSLAELLGSYPLLGVPCEPFAAFGQLELVLFRNSVGKLICCQPHPCRSATPSI